jgi:hypothetical protein
VVLPVPVPTTAGPDSASRTNIGDSTPASIEIGTTTRRQILFALGEPDGRGAADQWFTYGALERRGGVQWLMVVAGGVGYGTTGGASRISNWDSSQRVMIRFNDLGIVIGVQTEQRNCTGEGDCLSASGKEVAAEEARQTALARAGKILRQYDGLEVAESKHPGCGYPGIGKNTHDYKFFTVGERALVWQDTDTNTWETLPLENIQEVQPLEKHWPNHWMIPIRRVDGACMFLSVTRGVVILDQKDQEEARSAILERIQTAPGEHDSASH